MFEILLGVAFIVLASKTGPALARRIGGQAATPDMERRLADLEDGTEELRERLMTLGSESHERLMELEERVDFTERVLHEQREQTRLEPGGEPGPDGYQH